MKSEQTKIIFTTLVISVLLLNNSTWLFHNENQIIHVPVSSNINNKNLEDLPFIDPAINSLTENNTNLQQEISVIIQFRQGSNNPNSFNQNLKKIRDISSQTSQKELNIKTIYKDFHSIEVRSTLQNILSFQKISGIKGIYLNCPKNIESYDIATDQQLNSKSQKNSVKNPESASTEDSFNLSTFVDRDQLAQKLNRNISETTGENTVIAVLDTGIDGSSENTDAYQTLNLDLSSALNNFDHDIFFPNQTDQNITVHLAGSASFIPFDSLDFIDINGSGTFYAGVAAGTGINNMTYSGIAPNASILNVKVIEFGITYYSFVLSGLQWALSHDADIVLIPWSFPGFPDDPICTAVDEMVEKGISVIVATGNDGPAYTSTFSPAQSRQAIRVGAYNQFENTVASFSSRGSTFDMRQGTDLLAPGVNISGPTSRFTEIGTSQSLINRSSTGAAAAIIAGACSILLSLFPMATPEMLKIALMKTSLPIGIDMDPNSEGSGLINTTAAALFLEKYIQSNNQFPTRFSGTPSYPGIIMNADVFALANISVPRTFNDENYNLFGLMSSYGIIDAMIVMNNSDFSSNSEIPDIHLPLNLFAFSYNNTMVNFAELSVCQQMDVTAKFLDPSLYTRYTSVLNYDDSLYISIVVESWSYTYEALTDLAPIPDFSEIDFSNYNISDLLPPNTYLNYTGRIPAFKISIGFINTGQLTYNNLTMYSMFKSDLYLNEKGITNYNQLQANKIMDAGNDDIIEFDQNIQMMTDHDQYNEGINATGEWTEMGFKSISHPLDSWCINKSMGLFTSFFSGKTLQFSNSSESGVNTGQDDFGFAENWRISQEFHPNQIEKFEAVLGLGKGDTENDAHSNLLNTFEKIVNYSKNFQINDIGIISASTPRTGRLKQEFDSDIKIINLGTSTINSTELYFIVNYTSSEQLAEFTSKVFQVNEIRPLEIQTYHASWMPTEEGLYNIGWRIGGISEGWGTQDDDELNDLITRTCVIYDYSNLSTHLSDLLLITPNILPIKPFIVEYTGDAAPMNLTILSPLPLNEISISLTGKGTEVINIDKTQWSTGNCYDQFQLMIIIPLTYRPLPYIINLHISVQNQLAHQVIPIQFVLNENLGRIMFDGLHSRIIPDFSPNNMNFSIDGNMITGGFDLTSLFQERLETLYGNYYLLHSQLAHCNQKGMSMMQILPNIDFSGMLGDAFDMSGLTGNTNENSNENESGNGTKTGNGTDSTSMGDSMAIQQIFNGKNFFTPMDNLSTQFYSYDLIKFFDAVVLTNPDIRFTDYELDAFQKYMELGGVIFLFAENNSFSNISVLNEVARLGGIQITRSLDINNNESQTQMIFSSEFEKYNISGQPNLFSNVSTISLQNPLNISINSSVSSEQYDIHNISDWLAYSKIGNGKLVICGDNDILTQAGMMKADNAQFIENLYNSMLNHRFEWQTILSNSTVNRGDDFYIGLNLQNQELSPFLQEDFLSLAGIVDDQGNSIPIQLFGYDIPILPLIKTNSTSLYAQINSTWAGSADKIWISLMVDSPYALTETFVFCVNLTGTFSESTWQEYSPPHPDYPPFVEIIFVAILLAMVIAFWQHSIQKERIRHKYINIDDKVKNSVKTRLSGLESMIGQLNSGIKSKRLDSIEKIRFVLMNEKRLSKTIEDINDLASELGEK
ncbi:MAG: S8 family serine peptidase [Promethearchaeota archaeon]